MNNVENNTVNEEFRTSKIREKSHFHSKSIAFVSIMAALGTILSWVSTMTLPIGTNVSVDLSHIGTYIVAIGGGPLLGTITGAIVGTIPAMQFANAALIPGKMMTGCSVGLIMVLFKRVPKIKDNENLRFLSILIAGILGYIPEFIFTIWDLKYIVLMPDAIIISILFKAWIEIIVISVLTAILFRIPNINMGVQGLIGDEVNLKPSEYLISIIVILSSIAMLLTVFMNLGFGWNDASVLTNVFWGWLLGMVIVLVIITIILAVQIKREYY